MTVVDREATTAAAGGFRSGWLAVGAVTLGIFTLMTSELLPVGLLTPVGETLRVSSGVAGLMVTVPGLVAAVSAPVVAIIAGRWDRRWLLCGLITLVAIANLASAVAPHLAAMLIARVLVGVSVGGFWALAGGLAIRLVPRRQVARATTVIFGGVAAASVLGVPAATLLGELAGWRVAFAAVGLLALAALVALVWLLPSLPTTEPVRLRELRQLWSRNVAVRVGVLITALLITGHFVAFTFLRPILQDLVGVDGRLIGVVLLGYGVAGLIGNAVAGVGAGAARRVRWTVLLIAATMTGILTLLAALGRITVAGTVLVLVWGLAYGGVSVTLQAWMMRAAPRAVEAATSLFVAVFNLSIALGALLGGVLVDRLATASVALAAGVLALLVVVVVITTRSTARLQ